MKKRMYLVGAIVWGLLCLASCSADDDGPDLAKRITVYGSSFDLSTGICWQGNPYVVRSRVPFIFEDVYTNAAGDEVRDEVEGFSEGADTEVFGNFQFSLYERGMVFNEKLSRISGKGVCLCFHMVSAETDRLVPGKYTYAEARAANTFVAYLSSEYDPENLGTPAVISEGEVIVKEDGDEYDVEFRCKTSSGGEVSGNYRGRILQVKVNQQAAAAYEDVTLNGLMRFVHSKMEFFGDLISEDDYLDTDYDAAFFSTSIGDTRLASVPGKESVDIALIWNRDDHYFQFESPIRMRAMLGHNDTYNHPCHTIYAWAPGSFTQDDFDKLEVTGFDFDVVEEKVTLGTEPFEGGFVFFKTGNGIKGVIHLKDFSPMTSRVTTQIVFTVTSEIAPALIMDVKSEVSFQNPIMR